MRNIQVFAVVGCTLLAAGCSNEAPSCSSEEVKQLVYQITQESHQADLARSGMVSPQLDRELNAIRVSNTDAQTGAHLCAAQMTITGPQIASQVDIIYKVENTSKPGEFFVTVEILHGTQKIL